jgi:hypothetical protein
MADPGDRLWPLADAQRIADGVRFVVAGEAV